MILQALCTYYDALAARGEISPPGWCEAKVSFALDISGDGTLHGVIPLKIPTVDGKKQVPQLLRVPEQVKKTSGVSANFLCENSSYFLGIDDKGKPARSIQCFEAARKLHEQILSGVDSPAARGVLAFFSRWQPEGAASHPALAAYLDEITKGANLVFSVDGQYAQDDLAIRAAWQAHYVTKTENAVMGRCLVTGQAAPIARLHPAIKGVQGAQSSGASLVSFNAAAFESYGHEQADETGQGFNSPVSENAAFAYGTVLNRLLADREHVQYIGDTAVLCWAEDGESLCQDLFCGAMFGNAFDRITQDDLWNAVKALAKGNPVDLNGIPLHPENHFYVLGLAPSAARLSVRFFLQDTFGNLLTHLLEHYKRLEIVKPSFLENGALPLWKLLNETVNQNSRDKKASPPMAGAVARSILTGGVYPVSLLNNTLIRIRAEQTVTYGRAAIIQAYYRRLNVPFIPQEVLKMNLDRNTDYMPYLLGRLFALFEQVQKTSADGNLNSTIKDRFLKSAAVTPDYVFQILIPLDEAHFAKLQRDKPGLAYMFQREKLQIFSLMKTDFPKHMSTHEQNVFYLGYYKQLNYDYKKEESDHV